MTMALFFLEAVAGRRGGGAQKPSLACPELPELEEGAAVSLASGGVCGTEVATTWLFMDQGL